MYFCNCLVTLAEKGFAKLRNSRDVDEEIGTMRKRANVTVEPKEVRYEQRHIWIGVAVVEHDLREGRENSEGKEYEAVNASH